MDQKHKESDVKTRIKISMQSHNNNISQTHTIKKSQEKNIRPRYRIERCGGAAC
jgi:hypothetical protein